jgi:trk system potassium uptake protein
MHVIVVGCGRVGSGIAHSLDAAQHSVTVIDRKASSFKRLDPSFGGKTIVGVGFDREVLTEAGIQHADAVTAVTNGDNSNILIARVARETFGVAQVVARIYDPRRATIYERLGVPTIATAAWTSERILGRIMADHHIGEWIDPSAKFTLIERTIPPHWARKTVAEFETAACVRVSLVVRLGEPQLPEAAFLLQEGDVVHAMVATTKTQNCDGALSNVTSATGGHA